MAGHAARLLATGPDAAEAAGYPGFAPDASLVNRYVPGARMALLQARMACDSRRPSSPFRWVYPPPFCSVARCAPSRAARIVLVHGDVVVWGGEDRGLRYHGVADLKDGRHDVLGAQRLNLTFRKAL